MFSATLKDVSPDTKVALAWVAATTAIVMSSRVRTDFQSNAALALGFGLAGLLVNSAHDQRYPENPARRLARALRG